MNFLELKNKLRPVKHELERLFSLRPMQKVLKRLERKGYDLEKFSELELFGGNGDVHLVEIYRKVKDVTVWEYNSSLVKHLKKRFTDANVSCVDTYQAIKEERNSYDIIISDNPAQTEGGHQEHFDLFPQMLKLLNNNGILIVSIIPNPSKKIMEQYPKLFNKQHLSARKKFYSCEDPREINPEEYEAAFTAQLREMDMSMAWSFIQKRNDLVSYFVCGITKNI